MLLGTVAFACTPPSPPSVPRPVLPQGPSIVLSDPLTIAREGDQNHHATVAVVAADAVPDAGVPAAWVGWSEGVGASLLGRIAAFDPTGASAVPPATIAGGGAASKPDIGLAADGRVFVVYDGEQGVVVEQVAAGAGGAVAVVAEPVSGTPSSPDLGIVPGGGVVVGWYEARGDRGRFRIGGVDGALAAVDGLPAIVGVTDHPGTAALDLEVDPSGGLVIAWPDQRLPDNGPGELVLDRYLGEDIDWSVVLDRGIDGAEPRRPAAALDGQGRIAVGWRLRAEVLPAPSQLRLAFLDAAGSWLAEPFDLVEGDNDDLVIAMVGDAAVWAVWTAVDDPRWGLGVIHGGLLSYPDGEWIVPPFALSDGRSSRPHTAAAAWGDAGFGIAVSWEVGAPTARREVHGRVGLLPAEILF